MFRLELPSDTDECYMVGVNYVGLPGSDDSPLTLAALMNCFGYNWDRYAIHVEILKKLNDFASGPVTSLDVLFSPNCIDVTSLYVLY